MKKVFILSFVSFCFAIIGLVLWAGSASANPPFPVPPKGGLAHTALVPQTGQTTMYAEGDDGDIQAGVVLPTPRFTDNLDGTITDNLTHLIWLKNANCFGSRLWAQALTDANTLADNDCGLSDGSVEGDWRLPNIRELHSLINYAFFNPALSDSAGTAKWSEDDAFTDVQSNNYWSSTTIAFNTGSAWVVDLSSGGVGGNVKNFDFNFVLPVRGGL